MCVCSRCALLSRPDDISRPSLGCYAPLLRRAPSLTQALSSDCEPPACVPQARSSWQARAVNHDVRASGGRSSTCRGAPSSTAKTTCRARPTRSSTR
eukprot:6205169-Pleurochrysis_carterae.AAC.1